MPPVPEEHESSSFVSHGSPEEIPDLLPKLPLPKVEASVAGFLDAIEAVVDKDAYSAAAEKARAFLEDKSLVSEAEEWLERRREETENWSYDPWTRAMYLSQRCPLPVKGNPGGVLRRGMRFGSGRERVAYVARFVEGYLRQKDMMEKGTFPLEYASSKGGRKKPLCMEQYWRAFNAYRRPGFDCDSLSFVDARMSRDREEILVMRKSRMFVVEVKEDGIWIDWRSLASVLHIIMKMDLEELPMGERMSLLTAMERPAWAGHWKELNKDPACNEVLSTIENCLFVVCLDENSPVSSTNNDLSSELSHVLFGRGPSLDGCNRWYDKSLQLVFMFGGVEEDLSLAVGATVEHSGGEAQVPATLRNKVLKILDAEWEEGGAGEDLEEFVEKSSGKIREVKFPQRIAKGMKKDLLKTADEFTRLASDMDLEVLVFSDFGKSLVSEGLGCPPDALVQMALQLAYHRMHGGRLCFTYESASCRAFRLGRADNVHPATKEALEWIKSMEDRDVSSDDRKRLFWSAVSRHLDKTRSCLRGKGMDAHLLGVKMALEELRPSQPPPSLFTDESFARSISDVKMTTSQVSWDPPHFAVTGYKAVAHDGYGISYNIQDSYLAFHFSSWHSCPSTSSVLMAQAAAAALRDTRNMLVKRPWK